MIQRYKGLAPVIHPGAWVHPMATVIGDVTLAAGVSVWPGAVLRGDCGLITVGEKSNIQDGAILHTTEGLSETHVGARVTVGHAVVLHGCIIGDDCLVGMGATVLDNARLGAWTMVAAGSLITYDKAFPDGGLVLGSPARLRGPLRAEHRRMIEDAWPLYLGYAEPFRRGEVETIG